MALVEFLNPPPFTGEVASKASRRGQRAFTPLTHAAHDSSPVNGGA
jgi:hypothetical protein